MFFPTESESQSHCVSSRTKHNIPAVSSPPGFSSLLFFTSPPGFSSLRFFTSPPGFPCLVCDISEWKYNKSHFLICTCGSLCVERERERESNGERQCCWLLGTFSKPLIVIPFHIDCIWVLDWHNPVSKELWHKRHPCVVSYEVHPLSVAHFHSK